MDEVVQIEDPPSPQWRTWRPSIPSCGCKMSLLSQSERPGWPGSKAALASTPIAIGFGQGPEFYGGAGESGSRRACCPFRESSCVVPVEAQVAVRLELPSTLDDVLHASDVSDLRGLRSREVLHGARRSR
jgi:hypothetical protein